MGTQSLIIWSPNQGPLGGGYHIYIYIYIYTPKTDGLPSAPILLHLPRIPSRLFTRSTKANALQRNFHEGEASLSLVKEPGGRLCKPVPRHQIPAFCVEQRTQALDNASSSKNRSSALTTTKKYLGVIEVGNADDFIEVGNADDFIEVGNADDFIEPNLRIFPFTAPKQASALLSPAASWKDVRLSVAIFFWAIFFSVRWAKAPNCFVFFSPSSFFE